jgi:hypothetical protein
MSRRPDSTQPSVRGGGGIPRQLPGILDRGHCRSWLITAASILVLAACGGGGGDPPAPTTSFAIKTAWSQFLTVGHSWTLTGMAPNSQPFTITMDFAPMPDGAFPVNGVMAKRVQETLTIASGGQSNSGAQTIFLDPTSLAVVGFDEGGTCSIATSNATLPDTATIGSGGQLFSLSDLVGCTSTAAVGGTTTGSWLLETVSGYSLMCWNLVSTDLAGTQIASMSTCFEVGVDGSVGAKARLTLSAAGVDVTASNF